MVHRSVPEAVRRRPLGGKHHAAATNGPHLHSRAADPRVDTVQPPERETRPGRFSVVHSRLDPRIIVSVRGRLAVGAVIVVILGAIVYHVGMHLLHLHLGNLTAIYTVMVSLYVLSRFVLAAWYRPPGDTGMPLPAVAIIVPAFNEGEAVVRTIDACLSLTYPRELLEVVVVDDGSSDDTWEQMNRAAAQYEPGAVRCLTLGTNQGKREAMSAGIRATTAEVLVFVDSDSMPGKDAVELIVQGFSDPAVGAIAGITYARNAYTNHLTQMQAARYFVSYQLLKAAESAVGAVGCCSGCFSAYRREAVLAVLERWEHQTWLGMECTYGDDRSLTNMLLRIGWRTIYDHRAEAWTDVPETYRKFFKQQLRWKKSWLREGPLLLSHLWRTRLRAFPFAMIASGAGALSPVVLLWNFSGLAHPHGPALPIVYLLGLYLIAMGYAMVYRLLRRDGLWLAAFTGTIFYIVFSPQLLWALLRIRDGSWGTRAPATAPLSETGADNAVVLVG